MTSRLLLLPLLASVAWAVLAVCHTAAAQSAPAAGRFELSESVQLDRVDNAVLVQLERVRMMLAQRQWEDVVETLRQLVQTGDDKLVAVNQWRYVTLREYCNMQLAALPPDALRLYRQRVDPAAERWYREAVAAGDERGLLSVIQQALASSWGDDALLALGEMALERGDYAAARWHFERIIPQPPAADGAPAWPGYPDTNLDLAAVRARLVLTSILEGSFQRATEELAEFKRLHPQATGRLGGREVNLANALAEMLAQSAAWPQAPPPDDWVTFAGCETRNGFRAEAVDPSEVAWRVALPKVRPPLAATSAVAEPADSPLSYHPLLWKDVVIWVGQTQVGAVRLEDGKPAWGNSAIIYRDPLDGSTVDLANPRDTLGAARFTATIHDGRLYARLGWAVTGSPPESSLAVGKGYLICLDLAAEGRLLWKIMPDEGFAFEGAPLVQGDNVYVAMRRGDVRPQAHVACFEAPSGKQRWRQFVCGADTPAQGVFYESTHQLLTLHGRTIYYNTNLGAVAALSAEEGRIVWLTLYPRQRHGDLWQPAPHWWRQLTPCLYHRGTLYVAPADSPSLFAIDASTGMILWQTGSQLEDAVHLLGAARQRVIASGRRLYWVGAGPEDGGRIKHVWPDGPARPGFGRGIIAGDCVLFPAREKLPDRTVDRIYVFDLNTAELKKTIDLAFRGKPPVSAGNLLVAGGRLVIATDDELICLRGARQ